jgi:hypothetical protein
MTGIISTDHKQNAFRLITVELLTFGKTPQHMFSTIGACTKIDCAARTLGNKLFPDRLSVSFPKMGDGIADKDNRSATIGNLFQLFIVPEHLPTVWIAIPRRRSYRANRRMDRKKSESDNSRHH